MKIGSLGPQGVRVRSWFGGWLWLYETVKKKKSTNFSVLLSINPACLTYTDKWMPGQFMGETNMKNLLLQFSVTIRESDMKLLNCAVK